MRTLAAWYEDSPCICVTRVLTSRSSPCPPRSPSHARQNGGRPHLFGHRRWSPSGQDAQAAPQGTDAACTSCPVQAVQGICVPGQVTVLAEEASSGDAHSLC